MAAFDLVVGTVFGAALEVAQSIEAHLKELGHQTALYEEAVRADFREGRYFVCGYLHNGSWGYTDSLVPLSAEIKEQGFPYRETSCLLVGLGV